MPPLTQAVAFAGAAVAAMACQATLAVADAGTAVDRVALVPLSMRSGAVTLLAGGAALLAVRRGLSLAALSPLGLCLLPWLPVSVPPAFLLWSGPLVLLPWTGVVAMAAATVWPKPGWRITHPRAVAGVSAAIAFSVAAWSVAPTLPGGDEPHYLIISQSLLFDGDLKIENNHQRGDYRVYHAGEIAPHFLQRGRDGQIYSVHAPGLPALVAPAYALAGHRGVMMLLIVISALGSALAWHLAWLYTGRTGAAWFGWAAVTFGVTTVFHAFTVYPDGVGGVVVLTGLWALLRTAGGQPPPSTRAWLLHGGALALLPWLHSRFALLAGSLGVVILLRLWSTPPRLRNAAAFLTLPVVSCAGWIAFFAAIYGVADPSAPYGGGDIGATAYIADGLAGLFFDQRFGLLTYAPVLVFAIAGLAIMRNRLALELLIVIAPYLLLVTNFRMWWAGWSAPARFAVPILFLAAVPAAVAWSAIRRRGTRAVAIGALIFTLFATLTVVFAEHGRLAYNVRTDLSLWIRWLTRNADLANAMPTWSVRETELFRDAAIWSAALLSAWGVVRAIDSRRVLGGRGALAGATAGIFAVAAMAAASIVWRVKGEDGVRPLPAQMEFLRGASKEPRAWFAGLQPPRAIARADVASELRIRPEMAEVPEGPAGDQVPLFAIPTVPAGEYRLRLRLRAAGGQLTIGAGREPLLMHSAALTPADAIVLHLPVDVPALLVRGDDEARRNIRGLIVEPVSLVPPDERLADGFAARVVRYGATTVYFMDGRSFPEPDAFWIGGARDSSVVFKPDAARSSVPLLVRNAPVENRVLIESGGWRQELQLQPGEERRVDVPFDVRRGASRLRFTVSSGFRPSEVDSSSADERFLGVWIKVLAP